MEFLLKPKSWHHLQLLEFLKVLFENYRNDEDAMEKNLKDIKKKYGLGID